MHSLILDRIFGTAAECSDAECELYKLRMPVKMYSYTFIQRLNKCKSIKGIYAELNRLLTEKAFDCMSSVFLCISTDSGASDQNKQKLNRASNVRTAWGLLSCRNSLRSKLRWVSASRTYYKTVLKLEWIDGIKNCNVRVILKKMLLSIVLYGVNLPILLSPYVLQHKKRTRCSAVVFHRDAFAHVVNIAAEIDLRIRYSEQCSLVRENDIRVQFTRTSHVYETFHMDFVATPSPLRTIHRQLFRS
jgi:hypothetical protein